MTNLVEIRGLKVEATTDSGRRIQIIRGVDIDIADGEIVALIGESGSGKTTIALTLMGYARPGCRISGGSVTVAGRDMVQLSETERAKIRGTKISYVPQSAAAAFNPAQKIIDQVIEVTRIHDLMPPQEARQRAVELFKALSLPNPETIGERYPHQVSGGQLQRLSAAMALIGNPELVIFDEPTTALDVTTQIEVLRAFKSAMRKGGIGGVYVSHDLAVVAQIADRIVVLKGGEIQETGTTTDILENAQHPYTRELLTAFNDKVRTVAPLKQSDAKPLLDIEKLIAGYGTKGDDHMPLVRAVDSVSLAVYPGRNLGIIGEIRLRKIDAGARHCRHSARRQRSCHLRRPAAGCRRPPTHQRSIAPHADRLPICRYGAQPGQIHRGYSRPATDLLSRHERQGARRPDRPVAGYGEAAALGSPPPSFRPVGRTEAARQLRPRARSRTIAHHLR